MTLPAAPAAPAKVVNLMEALRQSVEQLKKPPASEVRFIAHQVLQNVGVGDQVARLEGKRRGRYSVDWGRVVGAERFRGTVDLVDHHGPRITSDPPEAPEDKREVVSEGKRLRIGRGRRGGKIVGGVSKLYKDNTIS